jgi:hypothetical protein
MKKKKSFNRKTNWRWLRLGRTFAFALAMRGTLCKMYPSVATSTRSRLRMCRVSGLSVRSTFFFFVLCWLHQMHHGDTPPLVDWFVRGP